MVNKLLSFFNKEISGVHQAAYLLGFFALSSQILALFRDRLLASSFGAGLSLDIYYAAFRIPDLLFVTVASLVSISVLIPFLIERIEKSESETKHFIDTLFSFFFAFMMLVGGAAFFLAPWLLSLTFPSFVSTSFFPDLVAMTRIMILSPFFLGFSNLLASITQVRKRFFLYALSPVFYNVGIMAGIVLLYPAFGMSGLAWGVALGAFLHFFIQVPFIVGQGMFPRLRMPSWIVISKIIRVSIPRTITVSSAELTELFLISFASFLIPGSISIFNFAFNLQSVPFSIVGVSYALAAFPLLTRLYSAGSRDEFVDQMITTSRHIIFWSIPISVLFIVLRAQIVRVILGAGNFNWDDTRLTAAALALFVLSLIAQNLTTLFVRAYYSRGRTHAPFFISVISSLFIIGISYLLVRLFQTHVFFRYFVENLLKVSDIPGTVVLMLPLGFSIGLGLSLLMHWMSFNREFPAYSRGVFRVFWQVAASSIIMGYAAYLGLNVFDSVFDIHTLVGIFFQGFLAGLLGICAGVVALHMLGSAELREVWQTLHKKIWKAKVVTPDAEM